jgi:hypothetical protein
MLVRLAALALVVSSPLAFAGNVHVVSPSGPHTQIQTAVNAASDYDTILVKPHALSSQFYDGFTVFGKSLAIVGDPLPSQPVNVRGEIWIEALPAGGLVVLGSLDCRELQAETLALRTVANSGAIRIESCDFQGAGSVISFFASETRVTAIGVDADTQLVSSTIFGGPPLPVSYTHTEGQTALESLAIALRLFDCSLIGGSGTTELDEEGGSGGSGGHGLQVAEGLAFVADSTFVGGSGTDGAWDKDDIFDCQSGGHGGWGGDGISVGATPAPSNPSQVFTHTSTMQGGAAGSGGIGCSGNGLPGVPGLPVRVHANGEYQNFANGTARYLTGTPLARTGANVSLTAKGAQGDRVYARIETAADEATFPFGGASHSPMGPSKKPRFVFLGTIPASGTLNAAIPAGTLPSGVGSKLWRVHSVFVLTSGVVVESNDFAVAIVRPTF